MLFPNLNYVQYRVAYGDMVVSNWLACEVFKYIYINNIWVMKKKRKNIQSHMPDWVQQPTNILWLKHRSGEIIYGLGPRLRQIKLYIWCTITKHSQRLWKPKIKGCKLSFMLCIWKTDWRFERCSTVLLCSSSNSLFDD